MDIGNNTANKPLCPSSGITSTCSNKPVDHDSGLFCHRRARCQHEEAAEPWNACQNKVNPFSKAGVALSQQVCIAIPALPQHRTHGLPVSQLSERSAVLNSAAPLYLTSLPEQSISEKQRRLLSCYLQVPLKISDREEYNRFMAQGSALNRPWIIKHTDARILQSALTAKLIHSFQLKVDDIPESALTPELALSCLKYSTKWLYESLPAWLKTPEFNLRCLEAGVLPASLITQSALLPVEFYYAAMVESNGDNIKWVPYEHQSYELCLKAVQKKPGAIKFINPSIRLYEDLCILAINAENYVYNKIPTNLITENILAAKACHGAVYFDDIPEQLITCRRICKAIQNKKFNVSINNIPTRIFQKNPELAEYILANVPPETSPHILEILPDELKTEDFLCRYLKKWPELVIGCPLPLLHKHPEWLERSLRFNGINLNALPESERSFDWCQLALRSAEPCAKAVPVSIFEHHPELRILAAGYPTGLSKIPPRLRTMDVYIAALIDCEPDFLHKTLASVPEAVLKALPYDLLLAVAPGYLPLDIRENMVVNGDTTLPLRYRQKKPILDRRRLMEPLEQEPYHELKFGSSIFLKQILLSTGPFNLRNQSLGFALQKAIKDHYQWRNSELRNRQLPLLAQPVGENSTVYGGRTLMFHAGNKVTRMKFLRVEESLDDFFREEAVHLFTHDHHDFKSLLKSEVPEPVGLKLVPVEYLPDNILSSFRSRLSTYSRHGKKHYLVYEFTTCNEDYSTLAHQKESNGDYTRAEQGLLKACHDLGVWSSLGAVHTSTINAYHSFQDKRRELFLCFMFNQARSLPGALTGWDTRATDESDWVYSGLKDIGDMEFYPQITSYFNAKDADDLVPDGFGQRAAFMSAFVENMVAPVLHYARMHRDDDDYHYMNSEGRAKLGNFIDEAIGACLSGLMGEPVTAEEYFESSEIHRQWKNKNTGECTLWTARQNLETDCFARNLAQDGCYSAEVYPDQKYTKYRYPRDFTSHNQDNLGCNHGQFGLTLLIRGLYQIAAVLAAKLGQTDA